MKWSGSRCVLLSQCDVASPKNSAKRTINSSVADECETTHTIITLFTTNYNRQRRSLTIVNIIN